MKRRAIFLSLVVSITLFPFGSAIAQCSATETIHGAKKYNKLVCNAYAAMSAKQYDEALNLFISASKQPLFEVPNIQILAPIAETYLDLGQSEQAERFLHYDNLALLWELGIVSCNQENSGLMEGGVPLTSEPAKYVTTLVCGTAFDNFTNFNNVRVDDLIPIASAMLRYEAIQKKIRAKESAAKSGHNSK